MFIKATIVALSLATPASLDRSAKIYTFDNEPLAPTVTLSPAFDFVQYTEMRGVACIAKEVKKKQSANADPAQQAILITEATKPCARTLRNIINMYDGMLGKGWGERIFFDLYLKRLPERVLPLLKP